MSNDENILVGIKDSEIFSIVPEMANRHGLISGATGTGKTTTMKVIAEEFSRIGVPVFMADVKGDLSGFINAGDASDKFTKRMDKIGVVDYSFKGFPTVFWDLYNEHGHPLRATITEMGPRMLSRLMRLNDVQTGVMYMIFKIADDMGLLLLDYKDLSQMVRFVADNAKELRLEYGSMATQSIGAIQRNILILEETDTSLFFGEPALDINDLIKTKESKGIINILNAQKLMQSPKLYSTFLLWMLSELFEELPEVGDTKKPKIAFFFDEAHLLFYDTPKILLEKIEQVVRLIRSKGVGIYFVTQSPLDIPESVLGQLGNRVQHALRAYTPKDQKAVKASAETFRQNPKLDLQKVIGELSVGEAIVSFLDESGAPNIAERVWILPPKSAFGSATKDQINKEISASELGAKYNVKIDRPSAYEMLKERAQRIEDKALKLAQTELDQAVRKKREEELKAIEKERIAKARKIDKFLKSIKKSTVKKTVASASLAIGKELGKSLMRGLLGTLSGDNRKEKYEI